LTDESALEKALKILPRKVKSPRTRNDPDSIQRSHKPIHLPDVFGAEKINSHHRVSERARSTTRRRMSNAVEVDKYDVAWRIWIWAHFANPEAAEAVGLVFGGDTLEAAQPAAQAPVDVSSAPNSVATIRHLARLSLPNSSTILANSRFLMSVSQCRRPRARHQNLTPEARYVSHRQEEMSLYPPKVTNQVTYTLRPSPFKLD
jgi:hypothetical protein